MTPAKDLAPPRRDFARLHVLLAAMLSIYLWPALRGEVFLSTEVVWRHTLPWSAAAPRVAEHNPNLADHCTIYLPWLSHTRAALRNGEFPFWSGQSYAGVPYFGNLSVGLLSPFTWCFVVLPFEAAFAIVAALKWWLAAFGGLLWMRALGKSGWAALLPSLAFAFAGFQVVWIQSALTHVSVLAPWCLWAIERVLRNPSLRNATLLGFLWFLQFAGGHPETSFYLVLGTLLYALVRAGQGDGCGRRLVFVAGAGLLALLMGLVQILPFLDYALHSEGMRLRQGEISRPWIAPWSFGGVLIGAAVLFVPWLARRISLPPRTRWLTSAMCTGIVAALLKLVGLRRETAMQWLVDLYGNPLSGGQYGGPLHYTDCAAGFCGSLSAVLACAALSSSRKDRLSRALLICLMVVGARAFRLPWISQLLDSLPMFSSTGSTRSLAMVSLYFSALAGLGLQAVLEDRGRFFRALARCLGLVLGLMIPLERLLPEASSVESPQISLDLAPRLTLSASETGSALRMPIRGRADRNILDVEVSVNDVSLGKTRWVDDNDGARAFEAGWIGFGQVEAGRYRVVARGLDKDHQTIAKCERSVDLLRPFRPDRRWWIPAAVLCLGAIVLGVRAGVRRAGGLLTGLVVVELAIFGARYNDFTPRERMPSALDPIPALQQKLEQDGPFRVLGAQTILQPNLHYCFGLSVLRGYDALEPSVYASVLRFLYEDGTEVPWLLQDFDTMKLEGPLADVLNLRFVLSTRETPDPGWEERWRGNGLVLYENVDVLPRAYTVDQAVRFQPDLDPLPEEAVWKTAVISDRPARAFPSPGKVEHLEYRDGWIAATVRSEGGTFLIVSENWDKGWRASIDGEPAEVVPTHLSLMSLEVPAGDHRVELSYLPRHLGWSAPLSTAAVLLVIASWLVPRRARNEFHPSP